MSPRVSRFAALGLLIVVVMALFSYGLSPLTQGYIDRSDEAAMLNRRLSSLRKLLVNEAVVDEELVRLNLLSGLSSNSFHKKSELFLDGSKAAIASANLREFVSDIVKQSGGVLVSTQEYDAQSLDIASAVGLRVQFNGETEHFFNLLYKLETARPLVFIDKMTVTSSTSRKNLRNSRLKRRRLSRVSRSSRMSLTVRMDIFGYLITGEA